MYAWRLLRVTFALWVSCKTQVKTNSTSLMAALALLPMVYLAGCASVPPVHFSALDSAARLTSSPHRQNGHIPYLYSDPKAVWTEYNQVIFDPVSVYDGIDAQFGHISMGDKSALANYVGAKFTQALLDAHYAIVTAPGPRTLRIHVTLVGVRASTPVLSPLTKVIPAGVVINIINTASDKRAPFTGFVSYAVEIYDGVSGHLLRSYVERQYPAAMNIAASFGSLGAAKTGIKKGASDLEVRLK